MDSFDCDPVPLPDPCAPSPTPTVEDWDVPKPLIQELKIVSAPVDDMAEYNSFTVLAQWYDDGVGTWKELWTHESFDAVERAKAANLQEVTFGATGLVPGKQHRFFVAWCKQNGSDRGCNCFSDTAGFLDVDPADGIADAQPSDPLEFPDTPVSQPIVRQMEDRFHRPPTDPKRDRNTKAALDGDGLGPDGVWKDDLGTAGQNGAHIVDLGGQWLAEIPANSELVYEPTLPDPHSYSEIEFEPHCTTDQPNPPSNSGCAGTPTNYRVDVRTRTIESAGYVYTYFAQVLHEPNFGGPEGPTPDPTIRVYRGSGPIGGGITGVPVIGSTKVEDAPAFDPVTGVGCVFDGTNRAPDPEPPSTDLDGLKDGSTIVFRIEAEDQASPEGVLIKAFLAWDCGSGTCSNHCTWSANDTAVTGQHPLHGTRNHQQGFLTHHWDLAVEAFRAGSEE